jgi:hypothetical protein
MLPMKKLITFFLFGSLCLNSYGQISEKDIFEQQVIGVQWHYSNQAYLDSLRAAKGSAYEPPHGGTTEITLTLDKQELAMLFFGPVNQMAFCPHTVEVQDHFFRVDLAQCMQSNPALTRYFYGKVIGEHLYIAFSNASFDQTLPEEHTPPDPEVLEWLKFERME